MNSTILPLTDACLRNAYCDSARVHAVTSRVKTLFFTFLVLGLCGYVSKAAGSDSERPHQDVTPSLSTNTGVIAVSQASLDDTHKLMIGDRISFRIMEDEEEPRQLSVLDSGEIEAPYVGRFPAAGQSCRELARLLKIELEKNYYYRATVVISVDSKVQSRGRVYIIGAVRTPGSQEIPNNEDFTLSKAVIRAGGFTDFANTHRVKVTRRAQDAAAKSRTFTVDVAAVLEKGNTESDLQLQPDDLIFVEERLIRL